MALFALFVFHELNAAIAVFPLSFFRNTKRVCVRGILFTLALFPLSSAHAAINIPITVNLSEPINVTGTPQIAINVGGTTRQANYTSGSGTNALTFTLSPQIGDIDLDGISVSSPIQLNGGTIKDSKGNNATLTFTPPSTTNVKVNYPSLGMDFVYDADGRYTLNGTVYNDLLSFLTAAGGSFTRASIATYFDSTGTLQTATSGVPRFDYDPTTHTAKGILIEESRKNSLRNSTMSGAVAGTPGTLPTFWGPGGIGLGTLTQQIVGTGLENGLPYIDVKISGTASTANFLIYMDSTAYATAASGQTWTSSVYTKLVAGSTANVSMRFDVYERNSSGSGLTSSQTNLSMTGTLTRTTLTRTFNNASTAYAISDVAFYFTNGQPIDITVRIAAPQLEQGSFATSYIPTTSATVTRWADILTIPTAGWYNAPAGTIYVRGATTNTDNTNNPTLVSIDDGSTNNRIILRRASVLLPILRIVAGGTSIISNNGVTSWNDANFHKLSAGYISGDNKLYFDGVIQTNSLSPSAMPANTQLELGNGPSSNYLDGWISHLKYYPTRVNDTQLQLLTQ